MNTQQVLKFFSISFLLLLICQCCFAGSASEPNLIGEWSDTIKDPTNLMSLRARLVISEDADISGSRTALAYLEIQNTNSVQNTVYIYHDPSSSLELSCELRDSSGKKVTRAVWAFDGWLPEGCWLALPYDSAIRLRPTPPEWTATNGELNISSGWNLWRIPHGDTNDYYLSGTLTLTTPKDGISPPASTDKYSPPIIWQGTLKLPPVKIPAKNLSGK
jgi:hypothetical protein